jgi:hypothetical protein
MKKDYKIVQDFGVDDSADLIIKNGDFGIVDSNIEHAHAIVRSNKNSWKLDPNLGVGIDSYLNSPASKRLAGILEQDIKGNLAEDNFYTDREDIIVEFDTQKQLLDLKITARRK